MSENIKNQIQNLARDLLNLEVITIIKPSITGRKMPAPKIALSDICRKYNIKMVELDREVKLQSGQEWGSYEAFTQILKNTNEEIDKLKARVKALRAVEKALSAKEMNNLWMLYRIKTMCVALMDIVTSATVNGRVQPTADQLVLIRKAWELGVEEVALKTVIQLDGDVITRVQESYATEEHATVHELHNVGVKTSLAFWKTLIEIVESFISSIVKLVSPK